MTTRTTSGRGWLTLAEAALALGYHVETLRLRVRRGELVVRRGPHGAYFLSRSALQAIGPPKRSGRRRFLPADLEWAWVALEQRAEEEGVGDPGLEVIARLHDTPELDRHLYRLLSVHRLRIAGLTSVEIAELLRISARHVRRLSARSLDEALGGAWLRLRSEEHARRIRSARIVTARLQRDLEQSGFRYHRRPWLPSDAFTVRGRRPPAHWASKLDADVVRHLRDGGLTDEQIDAIRWVGIGQDELNELILRGVRGQFHARPNR